MTQPYTRDLQFRGARGTISDVSTSGSLTKYRSDQAGKTFPFILRTDQLSTSQPQVADTNDFHAVFISYGQSWRSHSLVVDVSALKVVNLGEEYFAFGPQRTNGTDLLPPVGIPSYSDLYADLRGLNWQNTQNLISDNAAGCIGWAAARAFDLLNKRANRPRFPVIDCGTAYPGYTWDQLKPGTDPWTATITASTKIKAINTTYGKKTRWLGVGWTHGAFDGLTSYDYYTKLSEMKAAFDGLGLNTFTGGTGDPVDPDGASQGALHYYTDMYAGTAYDTNQWPNTLRQLDFHLADTVRVHLVNPRYPYPFSDEIHHTGLGYVQYGEVEALAKFYVHVYGQAWRPLYITAVSVVGAKVTLTTSASMFDFGALKIDTRQIEAAPQYGFHVRVTGTERVVSNVAITGANTIELTLAAPVAAGVSAEVSYAWHGPGSTPGVHAGVWGNIKREGPPSVWFFNRTIDTWLCNYKATVVAA